MRASLAYYLREFDPFLGQFLTFSEKVLQPTTLVQNCAIPKGNLTVIFIKDHSKAQMFFIHNLEKFTKYILKLRKKHLI